MRWHCLWLGCNWTGQDGGEPQTYAEQVLLQAVTWWALYYAGRWWAVAPDGRVVSAWSDEATIRLLVARLNERANQRLEPGWLAEAFERNRREVNELPDWLLRKTRLNERVGVRA